MIVPKQALGLTISQQVPGVDPPGQSCGRQQVVCGLHGARACLWDGTGKHLQHYALLDC